jgi:hypothetical protein
MTGTHLLFPESPDKQTLQVVPAEQMWKIMSAQIWGLDAPSTLNG